MSSSKPASERARALSLARRYAGLRARSTQEVVSYLQRRGVSGCVAWQAVAACRARGLLDDPACARLWAEQWARDGFAWAAIRARLAVKGFNDETIARTAGRLGTASADDARAHRVVDSLLKRTRVRHAGEPPAGAEAVGRPATHLRRSLIRRLSSRGFDSEMVERVVAKAVGEIDVE